MAWVAVAIFASTAECDAFVAAHGLQDEWDQQCTLIDVPGVAPVTSPRPTPRPE